MSTFDRGDYAWPCLTIVDEDGAYEVDVHCVRDPQTGSMKLVALLGMKSPEQLEFVTSLADYTAAEVEELTETDMSEGFCDLLSDLVDSKPGTEVLVLPVARLDGRLCAIGGADFYGHEDSE